MARIPTENESMALSYMMFFMQARLKLGTSNVNLQWILDNNPLLQHASVDEKNDVRRGMNALVAHQLLIQDEKGLCLSNLGQIFFEYVSGSNQSPAELEDSVRNNPDLMEIFTEISIDPRFTPPCFYYSQAIPSASNQKPSFDAQDESPSAIETTGLWNIWTILLLIMVLLGFYRILIGPFK
jgi:hypothetical protein